MTRGHNTRASTITHGRQYAVNVVDTVVTFECARAQHNYKIDFAKKPLHRRLSTTACKMMARWWSRERGGCIGECPKCRRAELKLKPPP